MFGERVYTPSFFSYAVPVSNFQTSHSVMWSRIMKNSLNFPVPSRASAAVNGAFGDMNISAVNDGAGGCICSAAFYRSAAALSFLIWISIRMEAPAILITRVITRILSRSCSYILYPRCADKTHTGYFHGGCIQSKIHFSSGKNIAWAIFVETGRYQVS